MLESLRGHRPGGRIAVWFVVLIAVLSIATGVVAILTAPSLEAGGFWGTLQSITEFSGTVLGFALLTTAWGMYRGYRIAFVVAAGLVLLAGIHGVAQSRLFSIPLVVLSIGGLVVLVFTSSRFTRSTALTPTQLGTLIAILGVFCYGTAGAYALRAEFTELDTVLDAVYFTFVTSSTVGYGDVHPQTEGARLFAISLLVLGPTTVGLTVGSLVGPAIERRLSRTGRSVNRLSERDRAGHIVVLGYDEGIESLLTVLEKRVPVTVVSPDDVVGADFEDRSVTVVTGDPTVEETIAETDIGDATAVLVAMADDARNGYAVFLARALTDARIVVRPADRNPNVDALERAGADLVVDPETLLANALVDDSLDSRGHAHQSSASSASASDHSG